MPAFYRSASWPAPIFAVDAMTPWAQSDVGRCQHGGSLTSTANTVYNKQINLLTEPGFQLSGADRMVRAPDPEFPQRTVYKIVLRQDDQYPSESPNRARAEIHTGYPTGTDYPYYLRFEVPYIYGFAFRLPSAAPGDTKSWGAHTGADWTILHQIFPAVAGNPCLMLQWVNDGGTSSGTTGPLLMRHRSWRPGGTDSGTGANDLQSNRRRQCALDTWHYFVVRAKLSQGITGHIQVFHAAGNSAAPEMFYEYYGLTTGTKWNNVVADLPHLKFGMYKGQVSGSAWSAGQQQTCYHRGMWLWQDDGAISPSNLVRMMRFQRLRG